MRNYFSDLFSSSIKYSVVFILFFTSNLNSQAILYYPRPESDTDIRSLYPITLLKSALAHSGSLYKLEPTPTTMLQSRALAALRSGEDIGVFWSMTSMEREKTLLPIRIPIDKGLFGWRILLISQTQKNKFNNINKPEQLKELIAGQGHDWPDTNILRENGFKVEGVALYESLFKMLSFGHIDYFPRSILEIWQEEDLHHKDGILVESSIVIRYPTAIYFFVKKENTKLAIDILRGLEIMIADGSFDKLFYKSYGSFLKKANLKSRKVFILKNSLLPAETPLTRKVLWFHE